MQNSSDFVNCSIIVDDICLSYRIFNSISLKRQFSFRKNNKKSRVNDFQALSHISFNINKGETLGLIGSNGSGKSTLLKALAGVIEPNSGSIKINSDSVSLLTLGTGFEVNLTGIDNIYINAILLGLSKKSVDKKMQDIIEFADIGEFIYKPIRTYSTGMRARLAFSISSNISPEILLIDEVLGVGDEEFRYKSSNIIKGFIKSDRTVVIASHSIPTIKELCGKVLWLEKGKVAGFGDAETITQSYLDFSRKKNKK